MEPADLGQHTSRRFNEDMERVRTRVMQMGGFVEQQLQHAVKALVNGDSALGEEVARDDYSVNQMESRDRRGVRPHHRDAPADRGDLRVMVAIIKTITDLERIGDEVEKVGYIAARLATMERPADKYREIRHLGRLVIRDGARRAARLRAPRRGRRRSKVARQDRKVDEEYESIQRQNITFMMEDPRTIRRALDIMWVVRALERIGDHAKNICEYIDLHGPRQGRPPPVAGRSGTARSATWNGQARKPRANGRADVRFARAAAPSYLNLAGSPPRARGAHGLRASMRST